MLLLTLLTGGRLTSRLDALLVFLFILPLLIMEPVWLLFEPDIEGNVLLAIPHHGIADAIDTAQRSHPDRGLREHRRRPGPALVGRLAALGAGRCCRRSPARSCCSSTWRC